MYALIDNSSLLLLTIGVLSKEFNPVVEIKVLCYVKIIFNLGIYFLNVFVFTEITINRLIALRENICYLSVV